jgi:hypothetical protein
MTHPSIHPLGSDAPATDQVGLAMHAIAAGWALAVGLLAIVTYIAGDLAIRSGAATIKDVSPDDPQVNVMVYGVMLSLSLAFALAWILMRPVASSFRRFGLSMVAALGGFLLAMISTFVTRQAIGATALLGLALVALGTAWILMRRARAAA